MQKRVGAAFADGFEEDAHERRGGRQEDGEICLLTRNPLFPSLERSEAVAQRIWPKREEYVSDKRDVVLAQRVRCASGIVLRTRRMGNVGQP